MGRKRLLPSKAQDRVGDIHALLEKGLDTSAVINRYRDSSSSTIKNLCRLARDDWARLLVTAGGVSYANALLLLPVDRKHRTPALEEAARRMTQRNLRIHIKGGHLELHQETTDRYLGTGIAALSNPDTERTLRDISEHIGAEVSLKVVRREKDPDKTRVCVQINTVGLELVTDIVERLELNEMPRPIDIITAPAEYGRRATIYIQCKGIPQLVSSVQWMMVRLKL